MSYIESMQWPQKLTGRVARGHSIHGYDAEADLARHYSFAETIFLTLSGELPEAPAARAFEIALHFLAPAPVSDGPSHCAVLAQACGAPPSGLIATAAVALAEEARFVTAAHAELLAWLDAPDGPPPAAAAEPGAEPPASLRALLDAIPFAVPALAHPIGGRDAALLATLHACGLRRRDQLQSAFVLARLPCVLAEGFAARHGRLKDYPTTTPRFEHGYELAR